MKQYQTARKVLRTPHHKRGAFTLVEVLVALAVMMVMMTIILVPINMGMNVFHIGKARAEVQSASQLVIGQLAAELKQAVHVFPNEEMPGITDKAPYNGAPYYDSATSTRVSNTARLDFLLPEVGNNGAILAPPVANNYIVTYYAHRLDPNPAKPYDVFNNPIVLWRAQYPYRNDNSTSTNTADLVNIGADRYTPSVATWLTQDKGEPNLASQSNIDNTAVVSASHTQITPRDMVLVAPNAASGTSFQPDSSFICNDANGDGKIDRVTISLLLGKYDSIGAAGDNSQQIRSMQTVALPNIK